MIFPERSRVFFWGLTGFTFFFAVACLVICLTQKKCEIISLNYAIKFAFIVGSAGGALGAISGMIFDIKHDYRRIPGQINQYERRKRLKSHITEFFVIIVVNALSFILLYVSLKTLEIYDIQFYN